MGKIQNRSLAAHMKAIVSGKVTKTNVIGLRKALNACDRASRGWSTSRRVPADELGEVMQALYKHKPRVTGALHDTGVKLLQSPRYRKRLEDVAEIVANLESFQLVDFEEIERAHYVPLYRATAKNGDWFVFRNVPWQAGGNGPEILMRP